MIFFSTIYVFQHDENHLDLLKSKMNVKAEYKLWVGCGGTIRSSASVLLIESELLCRALCTLGLTPYFISRNLNCKWWTCAYYLQNGRGPGKTPFSNLNYLLI